MVYNSTADKHAKPARAPRDIYLRTWRDTCNHLFGEGVTLLPLTVESISKVAAVMKDAKYGAFDNYLSR
eukprot:4501953-Amphidinium_carterae.1